jgi:hypothetical protein
MREVMSVYGKSYIIDHILAKKFRICQFSIFHCTHIKSDTIVISLPHKLEFHSNKVSSWGHMTILSIYFLSDKMITEVV